MIDLVLRDREVRERIEGLRVRNRVQSDHQPVKTWIKGGVGRRRGRREERKGYRGIWDEEERKEFEKQMGKVETEGRDLEEGRKEVERRGY